MHIFASASTESVETTIIFKRAIARAATRVRTCGRLPSEAPGLPRMCSWHNWEFSFNHCAHTINRRQHLKYDVFESAGEIHVVV
jgi:hypothetical protein